MHNNIKNKQLLIVFFVLLALVLVLFTRKGGHKESTFNKQLVDVNFEDVTKIKLYPKSLKGESFDITKNDEEWYLNDGNNQYLPETNAIDRMLDELKDLKVKSVVANSKDRWEAYEVNDSLSSRVQLYKGKKVVADVYIGKFKFAQPRSMSTYVRLAGKKETYKVDGFLSSTFNRNITDLRDKTVIDDELANWTEIAYSYPSDSSFVLSKINNNWMLDGGIADSTEIATYINNIKSASARSISENNGDEGTGLFKIEITRQNLNPIVLKVNTVDGDKLLLSSENQNVWFNDQSLIDRLFVPRSKFEISNE